MRRVYRRWASPMALARESARAGTTTRWAWFVIKHHAQMARFHRAANSAMRVRYAWRSPPEEKMAMERTPCWTTWWGSFGATTRARRAMAHPIIFRATTPSLMKYPVPGNLASGSRKSPTASGRSTLAASCSPARTSGTTSSGTDPDPPGQCHPCSRFISLPMFPVARHAQAGLMFWFMRRRFSGSYVRFTRARRS